MGANLRGDLATIEVATARTGACVSLVFGDVGRQLREFGNLMPGRLGVTGRASEGKGAWQSVQVAGTYGTILLTRSGGKRWRWCPGCPGYPPGLRPIGVLMTGLGAPGGSTEGGEEEFDELRFSWDAVRGFRLVNRQSAYGLRPTARELRPKQPGVGRTQDKRPQDSQ